MTDNNHHSDDGGSPRKEDCKGRSPKPGDGVRKPGKRGRKASRIDMKAKLERSRQSARECRARKKLRYQYLEELVAGRERAIQVLRNELENFKNICPKVDEGNISDEVRQFVKREKLRRKNLAEKRANKELRRAKERDDDNGEEDGDEDDDDEDDDEDEDEDEDYYEDEDDEDYELE